MMRKLIELITHRRLCKIAETGYYDSFHQRYIIDLREGYLFYFPENGKILTTKKGLVYKKRNGKLECWFNLKELRNLRNSI